MATSKSPPPFRATILLAVTALVLFLAGEAVILGSTDSGRLAAARWLRLGDEAHVTRLVSRQVRRALDLAGVPADSVRETVLDAARPGRPRLRWRVGLGPGASTVQVNYAITRVLESQGAAVLSGREEPGAQGEARVTLLAGLPGRPTHEVVLVRPRLAQAAGRPAQGARLALVVFGFGDAEDLRDSFVDSRAPFALALPPGHAWSGEAFARARKKQREVVLHLPLEPINYPTVDPGPGAVLVTMKPSRISSLLRAYLDQAAPVAAVANHMGSLATQDMAVMSAIYGDLAPRHVPFLELSPAAGSVCRSLAPNLGVHYGAVDAVIDREARGSDPRALERRWAAVLEQTRRRGRGIVWIRASRTTLAWLPRALEPRRLGQVEIVPLATLLRKPAAL
jgi:hypothetical protein